MYVLGIDGGGTKTTGVISDTKGNILAHETVGATNQNGVERSAIVTEFKKLFSSLEKQNNEAYSKISFVFAGMSGVDRPDAKEVILEIISRLLPGSVRIVIDNDGVNALYSGTLGTPGIVQIAGTGSISFGINEKGERGRVSGWGYLIDDEGSGYAIGRDALIAIFKDFDGRGSGTLLTEKVLNHFQISSPPDLIKYIYEVGKTREMIAPLSKLVVEAADQGDVVAKEVLQHAGEKMAESIICLIEKLFNVQSEEIPVVTVGDVYNRQDLFISTIISLIEKRNLKVKLIKPFIPPVGGAVIAALNLLNVEIPKDFSDNFNLGIIPLTK